MKLIILSFSLLVIIAVTSSCGIKPKELDYPKKTTFPKTYPDISMDPATKGNK